MFISKKMLFCFSGVVVVLTLFTYLYISDTRYYLFKKYSGNVSVKTELGEIYAYFNDNKWTSISDRAPRLTEVTPEILYVGLNIRELPESAVASIIITLAKSKSTVFQSSNMKLTFKRLSSKYQGDILFKNIAIPFEDVIVYVKIKVAENGEEKSVSHKFYFKAVQKFEHHLETIYKMMSI